MPRSINPPYYGMRYLGNTDKMIVHDLVNEDTNENACQINEIKHEHIKMFNYKRSAHQKGFRDCKFCKAK